MSVFPAFGRRRRTAHEGGRPGFTVVETLTVMVVLGTLARLSVPGFHEVLVRARAAEVMGDVETVRVAVLSYHADHNQWPPDGYAGQAPSELSEYLPGNFSFRRMGYRLDWDNWALPAGLPGDPGARGILAVSVITEDRELGQALGKLAGPDAAHYALGDATTFVLERR